jgi:hypothetical protein
VVDEAVPLAKSNIKPLRGFTEDFVHGSLDEVRRDLAVAYNAYFSGAPGTYLIMKNLEDKIALIKNLDKVAAALYERTCHEEDNGGFV